MNWKRINRALFDRWAIKAGFLLLAVLLWFHVVTEDRYEFVMSVPLRVNTDTQRVLLATQLPEQVSVKFSGQGKTLIRLWFSDRHLTVNVAEEVRRRKLTYALQPEEVHIPQSLAQSVEVVEVVDPKFIEFELDARLEKKVKVLPQVGVKCASGFVQVGPVRLAPDRVVLSGPARYVAPTESVLLDSVKVNQARQDVIVDVPVMLPQGVNLSCDPPNVKLIIDVQELGERTFANLSVAIEGAPRFTRLRSEPPVVTLKVVGGTDLLKTIQPTDFKVTVDYRRWLRHGKSKIPATVEFPPYVNFEALPDSFTLVTVK